MADPISGGAKKLETTARPGPRWASGVTRPLSLLSHLTLGGRRRRSWRVACPRSFGPWAICAGGWCDSRQGQSRPSPSGEAEDRILTWTLGPSSFNTRMTSPRAESFPDYCGDHQKGHAGCMATGKSSAAPCGEPTFEDETPQRVVRCNRIGCLGARLAPGGARPLSRRTKARIGVGQVGYLTKVRGEGRRKSRPCEGSTRIHPNPFRAVQHGRYLSGRP